MPSAQTASSKTLIIAEKPSVARDLLKALPDKFQSETNYFEGESFLVSYAVGHLVTIASPKEMDENFRDWSLKNLPIIPQHFALKALPKTKTQLQTLAKLIRRKDVARIINACDAGREGELIFRYILNFVMAEKPLKATVQRLWLQSMTKAAMEEGLRRLRSDEEMRHLAQAALSRSEADWLVGINGSRALTGYKSQKGGFFLTPCGRVQTPTLSMLVRREREREAFVPKDFWTLEAGFAVAGQPEGYRGRWFDPAFRDKEEGEAAGTQARAGRIFAEERALEIARKVKGRPAQVTETQKPSQQSSPPLYDLTSLQREANGRFGFSARTTLSLAQALYERHKALTYPRTDSRFLPQDYLPLSRDLMQTLRQTEFAPFADKALREGYVRLDKRIFDDAKISDHHAIIPTTVLPGELSDAERRIYQMVVQRFLAVFFPPARFLNTTRISLVEGEHFRTDGKVMEEAGWRAIYGVDRKEEAILSPLPADARVRLEEIEVTQDTTKPPPRLTESTLLSYMESAGKYVEDEDLAQAMKERGLGTPATRAAVIEGLIDDKYVVREGKELIPTAKGVDLLNLLSAIGIDELVSPELTGEWEFKLNRIEKGLFTRDEFMREIESLTRRMVERIKGFDEDKEKKKAAFNHPMDGRLFHETLSRWESEDGRILIRKVLGGRQMSEAEVVELLKNRRIGPLQGFRSKAGKPFSAAIRLTDENKVEFVFEDNALSADGQPQDFSKEEPVGLSPIDGTKVYETLTGYASESALAGDAKKGLKVGKMILGKVIDRENMARMLQGEKTTLLQGFQSSKTRRFFDAYLKLGKEGKIEFEFPPREFKGRGRFGKFGKKAGASAASDSE